MSNDELKFNKLIIKCLEGEISAEEIEQLNETLATNPEACEIYAETVFVNSQISRPGNVGTHIFDAGYSSFSSNFDNNLWKELAEFEKTAPTIAIETEKSVKEAVTILKVEKPPRTINKFSLYTTIISAAALLFAIVYVRLAPVKTASLVGKLSRTVDARWQDASGQITQGCDLYVGPMNLIGGYAEITLDEGAVIVIEAPAQFTLESTDQIYLQKGQIVARKKGDGEQAFLVRTPHASVVDYGTEFGVRVDSAGRTETYVYEGKVQIRDSSDPIKFMKSMLLKAGQGAMADAKSNLRSRNIDPKAFVRPDELKIRHLAKNDEGYYRWRESIYRLHRDPSLVAHYFFEKSKDNSLCLVNGMFPDRQEMRGTFGDVNKGKPTWVQGRWPQKDAVRFERDKEQVIIIPSCEMLSFTQPLTISTWLYFPNADQWGGHLIACRSNQGVNYQLSLFDKNYKYRSQQNRFEFRQCYEVSASESNDPGFYSDPFIPGFDKWYHTAVVYDGAELRFYVNGKLFQSTSYKGMSDPVPADIIIGAVKKKGKYILESGDFDGVVDELMLFNRALSELEIQAIYEEGKP